MFGSLRNSENILFDHKGIIIYILQLLKDNPNFDKVYQVYRQAGFEIEYTLGEQYDWSYIPPRIYYIMTTN